MVERYFYKPVVAGLIIFSQDGKTHPLVSFELVLREKRSEELLCQMHRGSEQCFVTMPYHK